MTPLARWVLLALLLAGAGARTDEHACVRLCRAQNRGLEMTGVCDHQQKLVPQSSGGRYPTHRLFRLCLAPCAGAGYPSTEPLVFDSSHTCRSFRESLIRRRACLCPDPRDDETRNLEREDSPRLEGSSKDPEQHEPKDSGAAEGLLSSSGNIVGDKAVRIIKKSINGLEEQQGSKIKDLFEAEMKSLVAEANKVDGEEMEALEDRVIEKLNSDDLIARADTSEEPAVDWDQWCMAQCDNGRGGSACNCDIIP